MISISIFSILVIGILFLISIILIDVYAESFDETPYAWAWTQSNGYFKVYYHVNTAELVKFNPEQGMGCPTMYEGCHFIMDGVHIVHIPYDAFRFAPAGCNPYTHEMLHAWGYNEAMISDFFPCGFTTKYQSLPRIGVT